MGYQHKREPLTHDEANALVNACRTPQEKLIVWSLLDTGLRVSELSGLDKDRIDYQTHRVTIYGKGGPHGRRSKRRVLLLSKRLQELLESHLIAHDRFDVSVRVIQRTIKRVATRAKIRRPCSPHVLRHTFAVRALQQGMTLAALQHYLGHNDLKTTAIYLNLSPDAALKEFEEKW